MKHHGKFPYRLCCVLFGALAFGCQMENDATPLAQRPSVKMDPCAEQLHDLCGQLLLHNSLHGQLPRSLDNLAATQIDRTVQLVCPVSALAYVYDPRGMRVPGRTGLLVAYDATPCHSGMRWGILVDQANGHKSLTARVILLPAEAFQPATQKPQSQAPVRVEKIPDSSPMADAPMKSGQPSTTQPTIPPPKPRALWLPRKQ